MSKYPAVFFCDLRSICSNTYTDACFRLHPICFIYKSSLVERQDVCLNLKISNEIEKKRKRECLFEKILTEVDKSSLTAEMMFWKICCVLQIDERTPCYAYNAKKLLCVGKLVKHCKNKNKFRYCQTTQYDPGK